MTRAHESRQRLPISAHEDFKEKVAEHWRTTTSCHKKKNESDDERNKETEEKGEASNKVSKELVPSRRARTSPCRPCRPHCTFQSHGPQITLDKSHLLSRAIGALQRLRGKTQNTQTRLSKLLSSMPKKYPYLEKYMWFWNSAGLEYGIKTRRINMLK